MAVIARKFVTMKHSFLIGPQGSSQNGCMYFMICVYSVEM